MEVFIKKENDDYNLFFELDNENYIYKNNLCDFLIDGFDSPFSSTLSLERLKCLRYIKERIEKGNDSLYKKLFLISFLNECKNNTNSSITELIYDYDYAFKIFHGVIYDLCFERNKKY